MAIFSHTAGCNKSDEFTEDEDLLLKNAQPFMVPVPFKADLVGEYVGFFFPGDEGFECDAIFNCRVLVDAQGTAKHMGKIKAHFNFCACGPDDPEIMAPDQQYELTEIRFIAAKGDKSFLS